MEGVPMNVDYRHSSLVVSLNSGLDLDGGVPQNANMFDLDLDNVVGLQGKIERQPYPPTRAQDATNAEPVMCHGERDQVLE